ncbi:MAG: threonine synthase [Halobacteriovoraceae bacterium]|nr:threonine synthase [Halobacteriovoraceae bacterium]
MWIDSLGKGPVRAFSEALRLNRSEEGLLFVPKEFPLIKETPPLSSLPDLAVSLFRPFFRGDILEPHLPGICERAFNFSLPLKRLDKLTTLLELFHGPTHAFKDVGARFLAECEGKISELEAHDINKLIMVATSGDTGAAVASAFYEKPLFKVLILFPKGQVSKRQKESLTRWGGNIISFEIEGSFDDCQGLVKQLLKDKEVKERVKITSANSINVGRILPQTLYYAYASYLNEKETGKKANFIIPSGNMGNSIACFWAREMGCPIDRIYLSTNANKAVSNYYETLSYSPCPSIKTLANAMDVGDPNNMERLLSLYKGRENSLRESSKAVSVSDEEIQKTLLKSLENKGEGWGVLLCPHTATAAFVRSLFPDDDFILVGTAHPSKFDEVLSPLLGGKELPLPSGLKTLVKRTPKFKTIPADLGIVKQALLQEL